MVKFRIRKRKRTATNQTAIVQRPPQVITVNAADNPYDEEGRNERRWALQKLFASHLFKISRKHLGDSRQIIRRRTSLADASTAGDTSVLRPEDQFLTNELVHKPKPMPSFRITCGTNDSIVANDRKTTGNYYAREAGDRHHCQPLRCTDAVPHDPDNNNNTPKTVPPFAPPCSFWCPLMSFLPDSYNHDVKALDADNDGGLWEPTPPQRYGSSLFILSSSFLRKKPETKRNGIPKVITVYADSPGGHVQTSCCGTLSLSDHHQGDLSDVRLRRVGNSMRYHSFDTSIFRLEESLMRANLEADVEEKYDVPMHEHLDGNHNANSKPQDRTVTATSVSSSISTHSSLKFGASIVKLPSAMAAPSPKPAVAKDAAA